MEASSVKGWTVSIESQHGVLLRGPVPMVETVVMKTMRGCWQKYIDGKIIIVNYSYSFFKL